MDLKIDSKSNEKVKFVKSLNEKKYRVKNEAFYLEGIKVTEEVLSISQAVDIMFIAYSDEILNKTVSGKEILEKIKSNYNSIKMYNFSEKIFKDVCDTVTPQGILVVIKKKNLSIDNLLKNANDKNENILVLDKVQDAGNLGTIIRTAKAFNVNNIILVSGTVDVYSPKTLRSTMGTVLTTNFAYVSEDELFSLKQKLSENKFLLTVTSLTADKYVDSLDFEKKYAFVLGNEANGVSDKILNMADEKIKIDMSDKVESLNVSVAAGIILYKQYK